MLGSHQGNLCPATLPTVFVKGRQKSIGEGAQLNLTLLEYFSTLPESYCPRLMPPKAVQPPFPRPGPIPPNGLQYRMNDQQIGSRFIHQGGLDLRTGRFRFTQTVVFDSCTMFRAGYVQIHTPGLFTFIHAVGFN